MDASEDAGRDAVYVTRGLVSVLLDFAHDADPESVSIALATTPAGDLPDLDLPSDTPVFTDFYLPDTGAAIERVFGMNLSVPPGQTRGRFLSHPLGDPEITSADDLAPRMLVAVPPWDADSVVAFDRRGARYPLVVLDADPEPEQVEL